MSYTAADVKLAQKAQTLATLTPMASFDEADNVVASTADELYDTIIRACLVQEPWTFAKKHWKLSHLSAAPDSRFSDAWQIDPKVLKIKAVLYNDSPIVFDRYEDKIYCDYDNTVDLYLEGIGAVNPTYFPPDFYLYCAYELAVAFGCIHRNADIITGNQAQSDKYLKLARQNYSQGKTAQKANTKRIVRRRY